jgi:hypothetical protein
MSKSTSHCPVDQKGYPNRAALALSRTPSNNNQPLPSVDYGVNRLESMAELPEIAAAKTSYRASPRHGSRLSLRK